MWRSVIVVQLIFVMSASGRPKLYEERLPSATHGNPSYVKDRDRYELYKPLLPDDFKKKKDLYETAWNPKNMDYCDPRHCASFNLRVCGMNQVKGKFKWFQSVCHLSQSNMCTPYTRGIKYHLVYNQYCEKLVMFELRNGCPTFCSDDVMEPVCAMRTMDGRVVLFQSECQYNAENCRNGEVKAYKQINMELCASILQRYERAHRNDVDSSE